MAFHCSICGEESTFICVRCTKDTCENHLCDKCHRCSDCCDCELALDEHPQGYFVAAESRAGNGAHQMDATVPAELIEEETNPIEADQDAGATTVTELIALLEAGDREVADAAGGATGESANAAPGAGQWTILECLEHLAIAEERGRKRLEMAPKEGAPPPDKQKEATLAAQVLDRSAKGTAPDPLLPQGRFAGVAEALEAFQAQRALTVDFVRDHGSDLYLRLVKHPFFGELNGVEMAILMAGHASRHAAQMRAARPALEPPPDAAA